VMTDELVTMDSQARPAALTRSSCTTSRYLANQQA